MWPDAEKFVAQFKKTKIDVIAGVVFEELFKIIGAAAATAALGFIGDKYHSPIVNVLYWICMGVLGFYIGSRISLVITGAYRRNDPYKIANPWVMYPLLVIVAGGSGLIVRALVKVAVVAEAGF